VTTRPSKLWRARREQFIPFLAFPPEVRQMIYTTSLDGSSKAGHRGAAQTAASSRGSLLALESFDEDDLHAAIDWLRSRQERSTTPLPPATCVTALLVLYDVSSAAFEGPHLPAG
jgi:hypothetical protein